MTEQYLAGKVALVTGAGAGIGRGCALEFARAGADLVLNDRPGETSLDDTARAVREFGRECTTIAADVFGRAGCEKVVAAAFAWRTVDILLSNPALNPRRPFLDYDPDEFERAVQATLCGGFHASQLFARERVARGGGGAILFISSVHAHTPYGEAVAYNAAKAGLNHMMRTIAGELCEHRIRANAIEPGWIDTPGEHRSFGRDAIDREGPRLPWGRIGTPEDIGKAAVYLASDAADYVTGSVLRVDGAYVLKDSIHEQ